MLLNKQDKKVLCNALITLVNHHDEKLQDDHWVRYHQDRAEELASEMLDAELLIYRIDHKTKLPWSLD